MTPLYCKTAMLLPDHPDAAVTLALALDGLAGRVPGFEAVTREGRRWLRFSIAGMARARGLRPDAVLQHVVTMDRFGLVDRSRDGTVSSAARQPQPRLLAPTDVLEAALQADRPAPATEVWREAQLFRGLLVNREGDVRDLVTGLRINTGTETHVSLEGDLWRRRHLVNDAWPEHRDRTDRNPAAPTGKARPATWGLTG
ncbi:MAG: hypothetical protein RID91_16080 [Azospirillaceae bacterium]